MSSTWQPVDASIAVPQPESVAAEEPNASECPPTIPTENCPPPPVAPETAVAAAAPRTEEGSSIDNVRATTTTIESTVAAAAFVGMDDPQLMERKMPGSGGSADSTYVLRIHEMLEDSEKEGNTDIVSWQPHGRAFRIHKEKEFVGRIMPRYFKAKIGSFRRWLRAWGFVRMTEGKDRGAWYHRWFVRGVTNLCKNLTRLQMLEAMENWLPHGQIPDFYSNSIRNNLSETPGVVYTQPDPNAKDMGRNPKRLRGTVLEDLRQLLEEAENNEEEKHIVAWLPHGRAFKIYKRDEFVKVIMPRFFKTAKLSHLSDTLRIWGFRRLKTSSKDKGAYYHRLFVRGDASLSRHLSRTQMKEAMADWPGPDGEPDLYTSPPSPPLKPATPVAAATPAQALATVTNAASTASVIGTSTDPIDFLGLPADPATFPAPSNVDHSSMFAETTTDTEAGNPEGVVDRNFKANDGTYVLRIHEMLEDAEKSGNQHIVSWQPHGRAFRIHNEAEFEAKIMPHYFKAKIASFRRWLRAWGFYRMTEGKDRGAWYHRYFVRGVTNLCRNLSRLQMLKAMQNWLPVGQVPDFYSGTFLEKPQIQSQLQHVAANKNPKRLRGTILEDLRKMLEDADAENSAAVTWLPHGRAFKITNKQLFSEFVLQRYFRAKKYTYFSDILRLWGFVRLKGQEDKGAYFHRYFARGKPELSRHMSRQEMKKSMANWPPRNGEPDLNANHVDSLIDGCLEQPTAATVAVPAAAVPPTDAGATLAQAPEVIPTVDAVDPIQEETDLEIDVGEKRKRSEFEDEPPSTATAVEV